MSIENDSSERNAAALQETLKPWEIVKDGLNIMGLCQNRSCIAHGTTVIINMGFGEFDLSSIVLRYHNPCPMCSESVTPTRYGFHECRWRLVDHFSFNVYPINQVGKRFQKIRLTSEYIIIEVLPQVIHSDDDGQQENICSICLIEQVELDSSFRLICSHMFHKKCLNQWYKSNNKGSQYCPMCRKPIIQKI